MVVRRLGLGLSAALPIFIASLFLIPTGVTWSGTMTTSAGEQSKSASNFMTGATTQGPSSSVTGGSMPGRPSASGPGNVTWTLCLSNGQLLAGNATCPPGGPAPQGVAWDSQNDYLYVANYFSNTVSVINGVTDAVVGSVPVGSGPGAVAYDPSNGYLYVANYVSNNVSVINGATDAVVGSVPVGSGPIDVAYDHGNGYLYVANFNSINVSVINGAADTVVGSVPVGSNPWGVAYDFENGNIYVTLWNCPTSPCGPGNVSVINGATDTVVGTIPVGGGPWGVAYDGANGYLYVVNHISNDVSVINGVTDTMVGSVPVGSLPQGVGYDSGNGYLYVTNGRSDTVTVINGVTDTVVGSIPVGDYPWGVGYDSGNGYLYVTNYDSSSVSIVTTGPAPSTYPVTFSESGLPAGTNWSVTLAGQRVSSTSGTTTFNEPSGMYLFTVGSVLGFTATPASGSVTMSGASKTVSITFTPVTYAVIFRESGLPSGTTWSVTLNGSTLTGTGNIVFTEPNGSYAFTLHPVAGYVANITSGTVPVAGHLWSVYVGFTSESLYHEVKFTETGLPVDTAWVVKLGSLANSNTTPEIIFDLQNGSYTYDVVTVKGYMASMPSGTVEVNGNPVNVSITFSPSTNGTSTFLGLPGYDGYIVVGGIVAAVAAGVAILLMRKRTPPAPPQPASSPPAVPPPT